MAEEKTKLVITPVTLHIGDFVPMNRQVMSFTMSFNQPTDADGQVSGVVRGGKITLRVKAYNDGNYNLARWMISNSETHDGSLFFRNTKNDQTMKEVKFTEAYCVNYVEHWEDDIFDPVLAHWEEITISCKAIFCSGTLDFKNEWKLQYGEE